jgi:hypothetical protein
MSDNTAVFTVDLEIPHRKALTRICLDELGRVLGLEDFVGSNRTLKTCAIQFSIGFHKSDRSETRGSRP